MGCRIGRPYGMPRFNITVEWHPPTPASGQGDVTAPRWYAPWPLLAGFVPGGVLGPAGIVAVGDWA